MRIGDWVGVVCSMPSSVDGQPLFGSPAPGLLLSAPTLAALSSLEAIAKRDIPIAIHGEAGTGVGEQRFEAMVLDHCCKDVITKVEGRHDQALIVALRGLPVGAIAEPIIADGEVLIPRRVALEEAPPPRPVLLGLPNGAHAGLAAAEAR